MHNRMAAELTIENLAVDHPEEDEGSVSQSGHSVPHDDAKEKEDMKEAELKRMREFAARETKNVQRWRLTVLISIVAMGVLISSFTYKILKKEDDDDLIDSYYMFANTIEDAAQFHATDLSEAVRGLSESITASADASGEEFPFVTDSTFEVVAGQARIRSGIEGISYAPLLTKVEQLEPWVNYSVTNQGWIEESRRYTSRFEELETTMYTNSTIPPAVWDLSTGTIAPVQSEPPYAPFWMISPPPFDNGFFNYNVMGEAYALAVLPVIEALGEAIFSPVSDISAIAGIGVTFEDHQSYHDTLVDSLAKDAFEHPHSLLFQPVFDDIVSSDANMVGLLVGIVPWDKYLTKLLPDTVEGIDVVLRNTCGQNFTYEVKGQTALFRGSEDLHEVKYDDREVIVDLGRFLDPVAAASAPGHCVYSFSVYPTDKYFERNASKIPAYSAVAIAVIFAFMATTFFIYDRFVQKRNKKVLDAAAKSGAIVSSLFPSTVRDRLFDEHKDDKNSSTPSNQMKTFLNEHGDIETGDEDEVVLKTKPIADLFPETSILFADIAGFTAWSASREPEQVFTLLETLYRAFDAIAKRRKVFKVETIGDCYVAVVGLPDPCKDHATVMARFASDCLNKMSFLTGELVPILGPDTANLALRVGIHSGPVTAGVLRGERSRFQLFGDTMNTASRMESNSIKGKIQVSEQTANLLIAAGKSKWLTEREDRIVAKGKGELKTYWLNIGNRSGSVASTSTPSEYGGSNIEETIGDAVRRLVE